MTPVDDAPVLLSVADAARFAREANPLEGFLPFADVDFVRECARWLLAGQRLNEFHVRRLSNIYCRVHNPPPPPPADDDA